MLKTIGAAVSRTWQWINLAAFVALVSVAVVGAFIAIGIGLIKLS